MEPLHPGREGRHQTAHAARPPFPWQYPDVYWITDSKVPDVRMLDEIVPEAGAFYVMDRDHIDFKRLYGFSLSAAFLVLRTTSIDSIKACGSAWG